MKTELKQLYRKDKKLAIEVAQVLGYRIKSVKDTDEEAKKRKILVKNVERNVKKIESKIKKLSKYLERMDKLAHKSQSFGELDLVDLKIADMHFKLEEVLEIPEKFL